MTEFIRKVGEVAEVVGDEVFFVPPPKEVRPLTEEEQKKLAQRKAFATAEAIKKAQETLVTPPRHARKAKVEKTNTPVRSWSDREVVARPVESLTFKKDIKSGVGGGAKKSNKKGKKQK